MGRSELVYRLIGLWIDAMSSWFYLYLSESGFILLWLVEIVQLMTSEKDVNFQIVN